MQMRPIPKTGEPLPVVGCGTWQGFDVLPGGSEEARLSKVVEALFAAGGRVLDSSPMYGAAEAVCGRLLEGSGRREDCFLATKVWTKGQKAGVRQMEESLRLLRTDHVDLMQVHNLVDYKTHLATLQGWKAEGRTRYVGVTHYHRNAHAELEAVLRAEALEFVQLDYSLEDRAAEDRLLPLARDLGLAVIVNLPLGGGELVRRFGESPLPAFAWDIGCSTWSQLLLKFVLGHPAVTCAIPGTGNPQHMAENAASAEGDLGASREAILDWWKKRDG